MRCTCSPSGFAGAGAVALTGAEGGCVVAGGLEPDPPPMSAPSPRPKAGLAMGGEWRTGRGLSKKNHECTRMDTKEGGKWLVISGERGSVHSALWFGGGVWAWYGRLRMGDGRVEFGVDVD